MRTRGRRSCVKSALRQNLDAQVPLDLQFRDENGRTVTLADCTGAKTTVLVMAYYRCPKLCTQVLNDLASGLRTVPWALGKEFNVVTVSFDDRETPEMAAAKKRSYVEHYGLPGMETGWHFLTGEQVPILRLANAVGFQFRYDPKNDLFAHPSCVIILTPEGKVARYFIALRDPNDPATSPRPPAGSGGGVGAQDRHAGGRSGTPVLLSLRPGDGQVHHGGDESGAGGGRAHGRRAGVAAVAGMAAREAQQQARGASDRHGEARRWGSGLAGGFLRGLEMFAQVPLFPEQASTTAERVDTLFFFLCAVTGIMAVSIALLLLYFAVRYRRRGEDDRTPRILGNKRLEWFWTISPMFVFLIMFLWGASIYTSVAQPPPDAPEVFVVGKQWMWKIQHPGGQREINELHIPVDRPVKLTLTSRGRDSRLLRAGVPHQDRRDARPLRPRPGSTPTKTGRFHLFCSQYCGTSHANMVGSVVVMERRSTQDWLDSHAEGSLALQGRKLFLKLQCVTCHSADPQARAPVLEDLYGRTVNLRDGRTVVADNGYLRESIL